MTVDRKPDCARRVARLISIVRDLSDRRMTRAALAARYEVSERMITKDLEVLRYGVGIPVTHDADGYRIERNHRLHEVHR